MSGHPTIVHCFRCQLSRLVLCGGAMLGAICSPHSLVAQVLEAPKPQAAVTQTILPDARSLIDAGQFQQAAVMLRNYLQADQRSATAHTLLAYSLLRLNDPKASLAEYTRAAQIERPSAVDLQNVAKDYVLLDDYSDADKWMTLSVQMNDKDAEAWYGLGRIRFTLQRFQEAVQCFERTLVLLPRSVKAENNLGLAYEGLNQTSDAIVAYRKAIAWQQGEAHPSEQPLLNLGIILVHQGQLVEALTLLTQAVAIAPRDPRIREQLGHLYLQQEQLEKAQQEFEEAVALEPQNSALHFMLGQVYHREGQEQKAKAEFARSAALKG